ncbi:MAG: glycoside hydrolase family 25 protein [Ruminococcus sp.]|nr:glycoside hydrolase family 25 protein [Ruminococcus sp.]
MAYLDDNNNNLYTQGDPLEELDRELAELRATLEELDGTAPDAQASDDNASKEEKPVSQEPDPPSKKQEPETTEEIGEDMKQKSSGGNNPAAKKPSDKHRVPVIIAAILLSAALIIGVGFGVSRLTSPRPSDENAVPTSSGEIVTINDSEMGNIELQTVKGAQINTYTAEGLQYDEKGNPSYYEDGKKISHLGVDLSEFQGDVDFAALKDAGVEFVMLRLGGRYYGDDGGLYEDKNFDTYYENAQAAGLKIGAYFFSQANCIADAVQEADYSVGRLNGRKLDYPIAFDWENIAEGSARTDHVTGDELTRMAETFCDTVTEAGYKAIVYSNTSQMLIMYDFETMKDYDFWLADYREFPTMYYKFDMWQYSKDGAIDGVEGAVDLNLSFTDFSE